MRLLNPKTGFYLLVAGVFLMVSIRAYAHYKGGFSWKQDWLTWAQDIGPVLAAIGLIVLRPRG